MTLAANIFYESRFGVKDHAVLDFASPHFCNDPDLAEDGWEFRSCAYEVFEF